MPRSSAAATSPFQIYLKEITTTALLSFEEEKQFAERIAAGDPYAREHMIKANLRLVVKIARGYIGKGLSLEDLIEEGNLGLMRAVEGFDGRMETRFSTYASYWIKQSIRQALIKQGGPICLPVYTIALLDKWHRTYRQLNDQLARPPLLEEVAAALELDDKKLAIVSKALYVRGLKVFSSTESEEAGWNILDSQDTNTPSAESMIEAADMWRHILDQLDTMEERTAIVIRERFGLGDQEPQTRKKIGEGLGLTRERVRQIEDKGLIDLGRLKSPEKPNKVRKKNSRTKASPGSNGSTPHPKEPLQPREAKPAPSVRTEGNTKKIPAKNVAAEKAPRAANARKPRRCRIDPTTCDRLQSVAELEFGTAMMSLGRRTGRPHLNVEEIIIEARALGYSQDAPEVQEHESAVAEFSGALAAYKENSGRYFPTWSEVLEVMVALGYKKMSSNGNE